MNSLLFSLLLLLLPTQGGKHFWPPFAFVRGIGVDYLSPTFFLTDLLFLLFFLSSLRKGKIFFSRKLLFFFSPLFLSSIFSSRPLLALYKMAKIFEFFLFALFVSFRLREERNFSSAIFLLSLSSLFFSFLALLQFYLQSSLSILLPQDSFFYLLLQFLGERSFSFSTPQIAKANIKGRLLLRPYATFSHPNALAGYLTVILSLLIANFSLLVRRKRFFFYYLLVSFSLLLLIFLSFSRSAWIVCFLLLVYCFSKRKQRLPLLLSLLLTVALLSPPFFEYFLSWWGPHPSLLDRIELNKTALRMIRSSLLFGFGPGNFIPQLSHFSESWRMIYFFQPVHNIFLLVTAETGLIGFGLFLWLLIRSYQYSLKSPFVVHYSLFVVIFLGFFDHYFLTLQQTQFLFAFILGLCWTGCPLGAGKIPNRR